MKRTLLLLLSAMMLVSVLAGCACGRGSDPTDGCNTYADGRARPSSCGKLQVRDGKLCSESGTPVMLRGISTNDLMISESFINDALFRELSWATSIRTAASPRPTRC